MASSKGKNALQKYERVAQPLMLVRLPNSTYIRPQLLGPKHARRAKSRGSCAADRCWKLSSRLWLWCWLFKIKSLQHSYDLGLFMFVLLLRHSCTVCTSSFWQLPVGCVTEGLFRVRKRLFTVSRRFQPQWHLQEQRDFCWSQSLPICDLPSPPVSKLSSLTHFVAQQPKGNRSTT